MSGRGERSLVELVFLNSREQRLRAGWRLSLFLVAVVFASVFVFAVGSALAGWGVGTDVVEYLGQVLSNLAMAAALVALAWAVDRRTIPDLGLGGEGWWRNLGFGLVLGVAMTTAVFVVELAAGLIAVQGTLVTRPGLGVGGAFPVALLSTALLFVAVGIGEEVIVRGYLMTNVAEGLNGLGPVGPRTAIAAAAVLTSALFGVLHLTNPNATAVSTFNIAVIGLFFAGAYVATDDLGVPIGIHITWNFSLSSLYGFPVSGITTPATVLDVEQTGDPLITGGLFGPEAGLVVYVALVVAIAATWLWVRRTRGPVGFPTDVAVPDLKHTDDVGQGARETPPQATGGAGGTGGGAE